MTSIDGDRVVHAFNDTEQVFPDACMHQLFRKQAQETASAVALDIQGEHMNYGVLLCKALQAAASTLQELASSCELLQGSAKPCRLLQAPARTCGSRINSI